MEIDDKLASAIHGITSSDSESDFESKDLDEEYNLLKPPPYDYDLIKEKIIIIPSEKNYTTDKWHGHLTTVKNNATTQALVRSEVMLTPKNKLKHLEPVNQTKKVEVVASNKIRAPQFIKLNKHASQENIPSKVEHGALHRDHNFYKRVDGMHSVDRQTIYRQKKASTIPEIKTKSKSELESEFPSLQEAYKENYYHARKYNVNKSVIADFNDSISKKNKKKFKPLQITLLGYEDSSSQINLRDTKNNINLRKIEANLNDTESDGNTYNFNFNIVGKQYNSSVGFKGLKNKRGSCSKREVTRTTRSIKNLIEKCLNKKETQILREHCLSSREWMNTAKDPLENDIGKLNGIAKSTGGLVRVKSENQRLDAKVLHKEVINHSWHLPTNSITKESLNSPRDNRTDKKSLIPRKKTPDHLTNPTVQASTSQGVSKEIKVGRTSQVVSEQKKKYNDEPTDENCFERDTKKVDTKMQIKTRASTAKLSTSTSLDGLWEHPINARKDEIRDLTYNHICVDITHVKSTETNTQGDLSSNSSLDEFWDSSPEVSESGKIQKKKFSAVNSDGQLRSIQEGKTDTGNSDISGNMPKTGTKTKRKRKPKESTKNLAETRSVDLLGQDVSGQINYKKRTENKSQRKMKANIDQPSTSSGFCQSMSSIEKVQDLAENECLQVPESLFDEGFKDFIKDIVSGNTTIADLNCFTYDHLIESCRTYRQKQDSMGAQISSPTANKSKSFLKKDVIRKRREINELIKELTFNLDRDIVLDIEVFSIIIALGTVCYDYGILKGSRRLEYLFEKFKLDFAYANHVVPSDLSPLQYKLLYEHYMSYLRYKSHRANRQVIINFLPMDEMLSEYDDDVVRNLPRDSSRVETDLIPRISDINLNDSLLWNILRNDNYESRNDFLDSFFGMIKEEMKTVCWQCGCQLLEDFVYVVIF